MKTIEVDAKVYEALLGKVADFGETPNSVLRRILGLSKPEDSGSGSADQSPIQELVDSAEFRFARGVVGRFLAVLSWLHKEDSEAFCLVENIHGRGRLYFAKTAAALEKSGKSVNPKKIPDSPYWVITTTPTDLKQDILRKVMKWMKYDRASIDLALRAVAK